MPCASLRRSASNADLKGFHTPYGGSSSDLTELSSPTDRDSGSESMGNLIAAAAALGPDGRRFPAAAAAAGGKQEDRGRRDRSRASREESSPSDWSMGPESPTTTAAAAAPAAAAATATAAAAVRSQATPKHRRADVSPAAAAAAAMSSPVMSLSGHLIGPEVRRGGGDADMKKRAHDAFMAEVVSFDDYSQRCQVWPHC